MEARMSRGIRIGTLVAVASLSFAGLVARGEQEEPRKVVIDTLNVRDTLYHLTGGGGNSLGLWDEFGSNFVVVDTKRPGWGQALLEPIMLIGDQPVTMIINTANGGSGVDYPETLARAVASIKGISRVITGHTGIPDSYAGAGRRSAERTSPDPKRRYMTWDDLQEYADFNRDFLAAVREALKAGKSVDEAAASLHLSDRYKAYDMTRARANVEAIYAQLKK